MLNFKDNLEKILEEGTGESGLHQQFPVELIYLLPIIISLSILRNH